MKHVLVLGALAAALFAGTARGADFTLAPTEPLEPAQPATPSTEATNPAGAIALNSFWTAPLAPSVQPSGDQLLALWQAAGAEYGIPWQVLAAINKLESNFGGNMGPSSAGAVGWMQFMPSTWQTWGVDADGNGVADPWNPADAIYAAARYLAAAGGQTDLSRAIFAYNHAQWYVDEVLQLAQAYGLDAGLPTESVVTLRSAQSAPVTGQAPAQVSSEPAPAPGEVKALARRVAILQRRAQTAPLLSDRLDLQKQAVQLGVKLDNARAQLSGGSSSEMQGVSFLDSASGVLGSVAAGGYVFPVGGGAEVVSVSHTHHDYPAADIAAPEGSPVYAFADSVVLRAWTTPEPTCGIGVTFQTADGRDWTYCHLSYLDPTVQPGAVLLVGAPVGLVGSTGDASGPHLHLQLQPPTSFPQDEAWFQQFAGTGFSWQDGGSVFAVVG